MTEFEKIDQVVDSLDDIVQKLSDLKEKEDAVAQRYDGIKEAFDGFEIQVSEKLSKISEYEEKLKSQSDYISNLAKNMEALIEQYRSQIDIIVKGSSALTESAEAFGKHLQDMRAISNSFGKQLEEAKVIETRLMMERMELLISKAEDLGKANKKPATKKETPKTE